jgi:hypothetical protein
MYVIELTPKNSVHAHIWKEGGIFGSKMGAEHQAKQIKSNRGMYKSVKVKKLNIQDIKRGDVEHQYLGNLYDALQLICSEMHIYEAGQSDFSILDYGISKEICTTINRLSEMLLEGLEDIENSTRQIIKSLN